MCEKQIERSEERSKEKNVVAKMIGEAQWIMAYVLSRRRARIAI
jgi:hypothetical protein